MGAGRPWDVRRLAPARPGRGEGLRARTMGCGRRRMRTASRRGEGMSRQNLTIGISAFVLVAGLNSAVVAQDRLRIAAGLAGTWENSFSELGQNAGFFKKHGLVLDIFYTQGAGETQQAVISGSADIGTGVGTFNTFGAFAKGAPIRVIAATHTGANDLTWYVRSDSPIKDKKDLAGKTVAYSTTGSSTHATVLACQRVFGVAFTPVATGSPASTLTQVMSGQIDVGWTSPPFALDLLNAGKIRLIARTSDVPELRNQTARFMTANANALEARKQVFIRYLAAYREVIDWMYADEAAVKAFADWAHVAQPIARI